MKNHDSASIQEEKAAARKIITQAHEEFFADMSEELPENARAVFVEDAEPEEFSMEKLSLKDRIIGEAWMAYYTGDMTKVIGLLKENGLYDRCREIAKKYKLEDQQEILSIPSGVTAEANRAVSEDFFLSFKTGDIFLCYGGSSSSSSNILGMLIPGHWKHAGIMDENSSEGMNKCILSASNETSHGFGVGYETRNKWHNESAVMARGVKKRTDANGEAAVAYGRQFLGRDFNFFTGRDDNDTWYCSKVVWRCWKSQGIDIEYNEWYYPRGVWVTPDDIKDDGSTKRIGGDSN